MALQIKESPLGDAVLLKLSGTLRMGLESGELKQRSQKLVDQKATRIIMNLEELTYIDSYGLGELVSSLTVVKKSGGALKLVKPTEFVRDVMRATRLDSLFEFYDSNEAALAAFSQDNANSGEQGPER
jgi:anti-sigma B factor antagonist